MAAILNVLGMLSGSVGLFLGFYFLDHDRGRALGWLALLSVGLVGLLAFVRHVVFHQDDARRMGWETDRPDWAYEVGFANLAFGVMGVVAFFWRSNLPAAALVVVGYALYLLQASLLHGYRFLTEVPRAWPRLWRSCVSTMVFALMMGVVAMLAAR